MFSPLASGTRGKIKPPIHQDGGHCRGEFCSVRFSHRTSTAKLVRNQGTLRSPAQVARLVFEPFLMSAVSVVTACAHSKPNLHLPLALPNHSTRTRARVVCRRTISDDPNTFALFRATPSHLKSRNSRNKCNSRWRECCGCGGCCDL